MNSVSTTFEIVEESTDFLIVNKLSNTSFHNEIDSLGLFHQIETVAKTKLWPVHRLDKVTTGLLLLAKSAKAASQLSQEFAEKKVKKTYLAISDKKPKKKQGLIIGDMKKSRNGSWKLSTEKQNPARTRFYSQPLDGGLRVFWLEPYTGKTHQLRVAMKSIGSAILGDRRYAGTSSDRVYLHAFQLSFVHNNEVYQYELLPDFGSHFLDQKFLQALENLRAKAIN